MSPHPHPSTFNNVGMLIQHALWVSTSFKTIKFTGKQHVAVIIRFQMYMYITTKMRILVFQALIRWFPLNILFYDLHMAKHKAPPNVIWKQSIYWRNIEKWHILILYVIFSSGVDLYLFFSLSNWWENLLCRMKYSCNKLRQMYKAITIRDWILLGGMKDRGSTCKLRNERSAFRNLHVDQLSFIILWERNK